MSHSPVLQELTSRVMELEQRLGLLEALQQKAGLPAGYAYITTMAGAYGLSTSKAEELARVSGVVSARHNGQMIVNEARFREAAEIITSKAKRKIGSKYWYHPAIGKFTMSMRGKV